MPTARASRGRRQIQTAYAIYRQRRELTRGRRPPRVAAFHAVVGHSMQY